MAEQDALSIFLQYISQSLQLVVAYVSVLSAFLIMSYFAAGRLSKRLVAIVFFFYQHRQSGEGNPA